MTRSPPAAANGLDDVVVAGAAAEVAFEAVPDRVLARSGLLDQDTGAAITIPGVQ